MIKDSVKPYIPVIFDDDHNLEILVSKTDSIVQGLKKDILDLSNVLDPAKARAKSLDAFGQMLNADLSPDDNEDQKRKKIANAIYNNKLYGTWLQNKALIDILADSDCEIVQPTSRDIWALTGDNGQYIDTWSVLGGQDDSLDYGILLEGEDIEIKGILYINLGKDVSQDVLNKLRTQVLIPIGMTIHIGYMDGEVFVDLLVIGG